ncbi:PilZ domain-containing protein [Aurantiacibacter odishensis]|uniref:PilZ domain-containing protein n=1 Tax=Aurantiacibacter odishensis TaxID=1155476 RepID=UPI0013C442E3|nr:PilZ domain-containing protein [Aurantiacibacter odishensis]
MERRHFKRHDARAYVDVLVRGGKVRAEMDNLSVSGCRVDYSQCWLARGEPVTLRMIGEESGNIEVNGKVAWIVRERVGVRFAQPLSPALVLDAGKASTARGLRRGRRRA